MKQFGKHSIVRFFCFYDCSFTFHQAFLRSSMANRITSKVHITRIPSSLKMINITHMTYHGIFGSLFLIFFRFCRYCHTHKTKPTLRGSLHTHTHTQSPQCDFDGAFFFLALLLVIQGSCTQKYLIDILTHICSKKKLGLCY